MKGAAGWEDIRAELLRRIHSRVWPPGAVIPTEEQLAGEFGVARATVNRALRELAGQGLVERRRKAGTRVALTPVRRAVLDIPITRLEVEGRGQTYRFVLAQRRVEVPPPAIADRLGLSPQAPLLHLITLHCADERPFLCEDRWLNPAVLPGGTAQVFGEVSVNEWLVRHMPYSYGDIAFCAATANVQEASLLEVPHGTALFIIERTTWEGEVAITSVRLAYGPGYRLQTVV